MIHKLNIQKDVDYYMMYNVVRPWNSRGGTKHFDEMRYVNMFLHPKVPDACASASAGTAGQAFPCPKGTKQPLNRSQAPPPLKPRHRGYSPLRLDACFRLIKEQNPKLTWNFRQAVYAHPTRPERTFEYLAMKCLAHTYRGRSVRLLRKSANLRGLIRRVRRRTQIIGLLGHSILARVGVLDEPRGRIVIGRQHIVEDDPITRSLRLPANHVFITNPRIRRGFEDLGKRISPLAVIVLYHCYNGVRENFLQRLADLVDRPIFAYTGFLGWFAMQQRGRAFPAIGKIEQTWNKYSKRRLIKQEFNYQPEYTGKLFPPEGEWVAATPRRFDEKIMEKLEIEFREKLRESEKLEATGMYGME